MFLLIMIFYSSIELMNGWLSLILRKTHAVDNLNSIFFKYKESPMLGYMICPSHSR